MNRAYECGKKAAEAIIEMANLFYQLDTRRRFFQGLTDTIQPELNREVRKYDRKAKKRK